MKSTSRSLCLSAVFWAILVGGCRPPAIPPATLIPSEAPTVSRAAELLPATTSTPTAIPGPSGPPTATNEPEIVATKPEHIVGVWFRNWSAYGGTLRFDVDLTFREDSTFSMDGKDGMHIFAGKVLFADGQVTLDSDECYDEVKALFFHCTMTFTIYSTLRDGRPVHIRMVSDTGKGVFYKNFNDKLLSLDKP